MVKCQQPDVFMVDVVSLTMLAFFPRYKYSDANPLLHTIQIRKINTSRKGQLTS